MHDFDVRFTALYNEYKNKVFRYVLVRLHNYDTAVDISQIVFMKLYKKLPTIRTDEEGPYIMTMTKNAVIDFLRTHKTAVSIDDINERTITSTNKAQYISVVHELADALRPLSPDDRDIVQLKALAGYSYDTIAKHMSLSVVAVRKRYSRALQALRIVYKK